MRTKRFTDEQIIGVLKEAEAGAKTKELCRKKCEWVLSVGENSPRDTPMLGTRMLGGALPL